MRGREEGGEGNGKREGKGEIKEVKNSAWSREWTRVSELHLHYHELLTCSHSVIE